VTCKKGLDANAPPGPKAVDDHSVYVKVLTDAERRAIIEYLKTL
jgi:hypothetical protein